MGNRNDHDDRRKMMAVIAIYLWIAVQMAIIIPLIFR